MSGQAAMAVPAAESDTHADFCLWPYEPRTSPSGGWRSETILLHSFAAAGVLDEGRALVEAIRAAFGPFVTVWGIKEIGGQLAWEFYLYDYERNRRRRSATGFLRAVADRHPSQLRPPEDRPYFMFSVPFTAEDLREARPITELDLYVGNPGSAVSSGICYLLHGDDLRLKNFYFFFDAETQRLEAMRKLTTSAFMAPDEVWPAALAWPEMMECKTVVVANKGENDALYFSRIVIDKLVWFLGRVGFRQDLVGEIVRNQERYRHLLFDVGYDFRIDKGEPVIVKSSFYGYF